MTSEANGITPPIKHRHPTAGSRSVLIVIATLLSIAGLVASAMFNWHLATVLWTAAYLCKWAECWLLERALSAKYERSRLAPRHLTL